LHEYLYVLLQLQKISKVIINFIGIFILNIVI
jgi:hypothetical protein